MRNRGVGAGATVPKLELNLIDARVHQHRPPLAGRSPLGGHGRRRQLAALTSEWAENPGFPGVSQETPGRGGVSQETLAGPHNSCVRMTLAALISEWAGNPRARRRFAGNPCRACAQRLQWWEPAATQTMVHVGVAPGLRALHAHARPRIDASGPHPGARVPAGRFAGGQDQVLK